MSDLIGQLVDSGNYGSALLRLVEAFSKGNLGPFREGCARLESSVRRMPHRGSSLRRAESPLRLLGLALVKQAIAREHEDGTWGDAASHLEQALGTERLEVAADTSTLPAGRTYAFLNWPVGRETISLLVPWRVARVPTSSNVTLEDDTREQLDQAARALDEIGGDPQNEHPAPGLDWVAGDAIIHGPSAGVPHFLALVSKLTRRGLRSDRAFTGQILPRNDAADEDLAPNSLDLLRRWKIGGVEIFEKAREAQVNGTWLRYLVVPEENRDQANKGVAAGHSQLVAAFNALDAPTPVGLDPLEVEVAEDLASALAHGFGLEEPDLRELLLSVDGGASSSDQLIPVLGSDWLTHWVTAAKSANERNLLGPGRPTPTRLQALRADFESTWADLPRGDREALDQDLLYEALSLNTRVYRAVGREDSAKADALRWADEAIQHFRQSGDRRLLTEALLDHVAIRLEQAQLQHNDALAVRTAIKKAQELARQANDSAEESQKSEVLRMWGRCHYLGARPESGDLSEEWDDASLQGAYVKLSQAVELDPETLKNWTALAQVSRRIGESALQSSNKSWTEKIKKVADGFQACWERIGGGLTTPTERLPPLHNLAMLGIGVVRRNLRHLDSGAASLEDQLEFLLSVPIPSLLEAVTLLPQTEWERAYHFDLHYDLGTAFAVRACLQRLSGDEEGARDSLRRAGESMQDSSSRATLKQGKSAEKELAESQLLEALTQEERQALAKPF